MTFADIDITEASLEHLLPAWFRRNWNCRMRPFLIFLAAVLSVGTVRATQYNIINLGTLPTAAGISFSEAHAINASGQVAGVSSAVNGVQHAFFYDGQMHDLGTLPGGGSSYAFGLNDAGVVVGRSEKTGTTNAFSFNTAVTNAMIVDLGTFSGGIASAAYAVNNSNIIIGLSDRGSGTTQNAFSYRGSAFTNLGDVEGANNFSYYNGANAINASGKIVGEGQSTAGVYEAFFFSGVAGSTMMVLPSLPGDNGSDALGINNSNIVVGESGDSAGAGAYHAVYWTNSSVVAITNFPGLVFSVAYGINNSNQIVGTGSTSNVFAFIYSNGIFADLNTLIAPGHNGGFTNLLAAEAINDSGMIVGRGELTNGAANAFLAIPIVPAPVIVMQTPLLTNNQVQLNFTVTNLAMSTFHLLQTTALAKTNVWTTNTSAVLATNTLNSAYRFTAVVTGSNLFYRVQSP